jgi:hypothetical protein
MTDTQLSNIAPPADAIETLDWGICPCGVCDALTRVFITFRDGIEADDGSRIVVELTGVQEPDDEYRRDLASVRVEGVDGRVAWTNNLDDDDLREAAAAFIAAADRMALDRELMK